MNEIREAGRLKEWFRDASPDRCSSCGLPFTDLWEDSPPRPSVERCLVWLTCPRCPGCCGHVDVDPGSEAAAQWREL